MSDAPTQRTDGLLVDLFHGEIPVTASDSIALYPLQERQSFLSDPRVTDARLVELSRRTAGSWAIDALAARISGGGLTWGALRAELTAHGEHPRTFEPTLDRLPLVGIWNVFLAIAGNSQNVLAARGAVAFVAHRRLAGGEFPEDLTEQLAAHLLRTGQLRLASRVARLPASGSWARQAISAEFDHPRFGGSAGALLATLSQNYRRVGIAPITTSASGERAWIGLAAAEPLSPVDGPLVTVVMVVSTVGEEVVTAARSIVDQSYQSWELLIVAEGSGASTQPWLEEAESLDRRITVRRYNERMGTDARIRQAAREGVRGEYIALQSARGWSHPQRLAIQIRELRENPEERSNVVAAAWITPELSFVDGPAVEPFADITSLMVVRDADGLDQNSGEPRLIHPDVPLQWALTEPATTPPGADTQRLELDLLLVADLLLDRTRGGSFIAHVTAELRQAVAAGLRVGVLDRRGFAEGRELLLSEELGSLLAEGEIEWVTPAQTVDVSLLVVRHPGVAEFGDDDVPQVSASRVVVVDDPSSGDVRAATFTPSDVLENVGEWVGSSPSWLRLSPAPVSLPPARATARLRRDQPSDPDAPSLSIVMPVYNVAPYLEAAFLSVLYQDYQDFELIVVDDGSTDGSREIIDFFAAQDQRIRVITLGRNSLGGAGIPSNVGIRAARGKYLGFVDSDDIVTRGGFARMVETAERTQAEVVVGGFETFEEEGMGRSPAYDIPRGSKLPRGKVISATAHPGLLALSPVPWRKLYRLSFVDEHGIGYPEGDFFYEDNALHWTVLSLTDKAVLIDDVVSLHRIGRPGQTRGSADYRKGAYAQHLNLGLQAILATNGKRRQALLDAFVEQLSAARWVVREQTQPAAQAMIARRLGALFDRAVAAGARVSAAIAPRLDSYRASYPYFDLSIVVTTLDCAKQVRRTLDSALAVAGFDLDILVVDEGSTDGTISILRRYESAHANIHVFEQRHRGCGRARNSVIPLLTGRYAVFLEAGDVIEPRALATAVSVGKREDADLVLCTDAAGKDRMSLEMNRGELCSLMPPVAWNRLIKTDLLQDSNIFFDSSPAYHDVPYHWQSVAAAERIAFSAPAIVDHRKSTKRRNDASLERATRSEALAVAEDTHRLIAPLPYYSDVAERWAIFSQSPSHPE